MNLWGRRGKETDPPLSTGTTPTTHRTGQAGDGQADAARQDEVHRRALLRAGDLAGRGSGRADEHRLARGRRGAGGLDARLLHGEGHLFCEGGVVCLVLCGGVHTRRIWGNEQGGEGGDGKPPAGFVERARRRRRAGGATLPPGARAPALMTRRPLPTPADTPFVQRGEPRERAHTRDLIISYDAPLAARAHPYR